MAINMERDQRVSLPDLSVLSNMWDRFESCLPASVPDKDLAVIRQKLGAYISDKTPYLFQTTIPSQSDDKASGSVYVLLLPMRGPRDTNLHARGDKEFYNLYHLIAFKDGQAPVAAQLDRIPSADDYKKIKSGRAQKMSQDPDQRWSTFLEKLTRPYSASDQVSAFFRSFKGRIVEPSQDISALSNPKKWLEENALTQHEHKQFLEETLNIYSDQDPQEQKKGIRIPHADYTKLLDIMKQAHANRLKPAIRRFSQNLDPAVMRVIDHMPGHQTIGAYETLDPTYKLVWNSRRERHEKQYKNKEAKEERIEILREMLRDFPLLASIHNLSSMANRAHLYKTIGSSTNAQEAVKKLFDTFDGEAVERLRNLNEEDVGADVASQIPGLIPYFKYVGEGGLPATEAEWGHFLELAKVDAYLAHNRLRKRYQTMAELKQNEIIVGDWESAAAKLTKEHARGMMQMSRRLGLSLHAAFALHLKPMIERDIEQVRTDERAQQIAEWEAKGKKAKLPKQKTPRKIQEEDMIGFCVQHKPTPFYEFIRSHDENSKLSLIGEMLARVPIERLAQNGKVFMRHFAGESDRKDHLAIREAFARNAAQYRWVPLPEISLSLTEMFENPDANNHYHIEALNSPADLILQALSSQLPAEQTPIDRYTSNDIHYVLLREWATGQAEALVELEQIEGFPHVMLKIGQIYPLIRDDIGQAKNLSNMAQDALTTYIEKTNTGFEQTYKTGESNRKYPHKHVYDRRRDQIKAAAQRLGGTIGVIGHDFNDGDQNRSVTRWLQPFLDDLGFSTDVQFNGLPYNAEMLNRIVGWMADESEVQIDVPDLQAYINKNYGQEKEFGHLQLVASS